MNAVCVNKATSKICFNAHNNFMSSGVISAFMNLSQTVEMIQIVQISTAQPLTFLHRGLLYMQKETHPLFKALVPLLYRDLNFPIKLQP